MSLLIYRGGGESDFFTLLHRDLRKKKARQMSTPRNDLLYSVGPFQSSCAFYVGHNSVLDPICIFYHGLVIAKNGTFLLDSENLTVDLLKVTRH